MRRNVVALAVLGAVSCTPADPRPVVACGACTVFVGGRVFDGSAVHDGLAVVVRGDSIVDVLQAPVRIDDGTLYDTTGMTLLPGLIDGHVHLGGAAGPIGVSTSLPPRRAHALQAYLRAGVTSVFDLGGNPAALFDLRARINAGEITGPRVFAAGPVITAPAGHPCKRGTPPGQLCLFVDDPNDDAIDQLLALSPDFIKLALDSGQGFTALPRLSDAVLRSSVFRAGNTPVIVHVSTNDEVRDAVDAGVRRFAHVPADDGLEGPVVQRLLDADVFVVPALIAKRNIAQVANGTWSPSALALDDNVDADVLAALTDPQQSATMREPAFAQNALRLYNNARDNTGRIIGARVRIVAGTDAGTPGTLHGASLHQELALYVQLGLTPANALKAATQNAADMLADTRLGRINKGAHADLLVVRGDPTLDISDTTRIVDVFVRGARVDRAALALSAGNSIVHVAARRPEASACVFDEDCDGGGVFTRCDPVDDVCTRSCSDAVPCPTGQVCFGVPPARFCFNGDSCDVLASARDEQACVNDAACVWLGDAVSRCVFAVAQATQGQPCDSGLCAEGAQCHDLAQLCADTCDPRLDPSTCALDAVCVDDTARAGLPVGHCAL